MRNKLFGSREFYHRVLAISVPIMVQNAITNFVSLLDNVMIGRADSGLQQGLRASQNLGVHVGQAYRQVTGRRLIGEDRQPGPAFSGRSFLATGIWTVSAIPSALSS